MIRMKRPRIGQVHEIEIGPPLLKPAPKLVKQPARIEMIENEIAKFEKPDQERFRSCLYPSLASICSSADSWVESVMSISECQVTRSAQTSVAPIRPSRRRMQKV